MQALKTTQESPRVVALEGGPSSGKTTRLAVQAAQLGRESSVLALTPGHDASVLFARTINNKARTRPDRPLDIRVRSMRGIALDILYDAGASLGMKGPVRPLLEVERRLLLADLVAAGHTPRDAQAAYDTLGKLWDQGRWPEPDRFGEGSPERLLHQWMARRAAFPARSLYAACIKTIQSDKTVRSRWTADNVLVDDANGLGQAALALCACLANVQVVLAADTAWSPRFFDPTADARQLRTLAGKAVDTLASDRPALIAHTVKWESPADEVDGCCSSIARILAGRPDQARANQLEVPAVCCVSAREWWTTSIARLLGKNGIEARVLTGTDPLMADLRNTASCSSLRTFAALGLAANPDDESLWRLACAIGRRDLGASAWLELSERARRSQKTVVEALMDKSYDGSLKDVRDRYLAIVRRTEGRRGANLVAAIDPTEKAVLGLCGEVDGDEDAGGLFLTLCRNATDRRFLGKGDVWVGTPESLLGIKAEVVFAGGLNKPASGSGADADVHLAQIMGIASDQVVLCHARHCQPELAARLGLESSRTRTVGEAVQAVLKPDPAIARLGSLAPASISGQQFRPAVLGDRS